MKIRLHNIQIRNFKAFRRFSLKLESRHLLLHGANGAGKSSLYWALYTFLQSAGKNPKGIISKYFEPSGTQSLLNIHEQNEATPLPGEIALTLRNQQTKTDTTYRISEADHGTHGERGIVNADLASDFITYRFFFGFSNFKNSERFDLWPLFENEILPFCVRPGAARSPHEEWQLVKKGDPNPWGSRGTGGTWLYSTFRENTDRFATTLATIIPPINTKAQEFYSEHFADDDPTPVRIILGITRPPSFSGTNQNNSRFRKPILELHLQIGDQIIKRPQSFLNEAKMTQLALSVRLAASLINLQEDEQNYLKLLVLDDLLVSLDMNNRMKVVEIILGPTFEKYQKIILTHDRGFFEEFKRVIGNRHTEWCFRSLLGNSKDGICDKIEKAPIERASDYLQGHDLEAAAIQLRKAAEQAADNYLRIATGKAPKPDEFHSLSDKLNKARRILESQMPLQTFNDVCRSLPENYRAKVISVTDDDIESDINLDAATKQLIVEQRRKLKAFMTHQAWKNLEIYELLDRIIRMKDRVLNPAAHWNETPLYDSEVKKALRLVSAFEKTLLSP